MIIRDISDLHGARSRCGKFVVSVVDEYVTVATRFHDGRPRIVYSERTINTDSVLYDLYKVWNFPQYKIETAQPNPIRATMLVADNGRVLATNDTINNKIVFANYSTYELFHMFDCWETFVSTVMETIDGVRLIEIPMEVSSVRFPK